MVHTRSQGLPLNPDEVHQQNMEVAKERSLEDLKRASEKNASRPVKTEDSDEVSVERETRFVLVGTPPTPHQRIMRLEDSQQNAMKYPPGSRVWHMSHVDLETGRIGRLHTYLSTVRMIYMVHEDMNNIRFAYQLGNPANPDFQVHAWEDDLESEE